MNLEGKTVVNLVLVLHKANASVLEGKFLVNYHILSTTIWHIGTFVCRIIHVFKHLPFCGHHPQIKFSKSLNIFYTNPYGLDLRI